MQSHIFLISDNAYDHQFVRDIASLSGAKFASSTSAAGLDGLIDSEDLRAIFINGDEIVHLDSFQDKFGGVFASRKVHCFLSQEQRTMAQELVDYHDVGNVIIRNSSDPQAIHNCAKHYVRIITAPPAEKCEGLKGLCKAGTEITTKEITQSLQKRFIVEAINGQLSKRNWNPKAANAVATAIDEMIMNAIFDAPLDASGRQKHETTPRSANLTLDNNSKVVVQLGFDDDYFVVSVTDPYGTLKRASALKYVTKAFSDTQDIRRPEHLQGAGLGLALILRSGGSLRFTCVPGKKTEVIAMFGKAESYIQFRNQFQFISTVFEG